MAKGFGGVPGNLQEIMKQAQKMQERLVQAQAEAENIRAEASSGGGMVRAVVNGKSQVIELSIEKSVVDSSDVEMLQDLVKAAINEAQTKAQDIIKEEMAKVTGGMAIPGMF